MSANVETLFEGDEDIHDSIVDLVPGPDNPTPMVRLGERFNPRKMTAAHRKLPFNTKVRVTHLQNGKSVIVRINDRGPFHGHRVIDLAHGAASQLGLVNMSLATSQPAETE